MKRKQKIKLELLAPAKNASIAIEAIKHGADAVYIGACRYGARASAGNSVDDIKCVVDFAHKYNARVYVTVNTILYDNELKEVEQLIHELYNVGVDAIIVQDMAVLRMDLPPIALHASTQCDIRTPEKADFLDKVGFSQLVLARELTLDEIKIIRDKVSVPLEAFVHGALCVSYSGRCGISYACTKRSANRGECAQFCRLPYNLEDDKGNVIIENKHLLSLKDMNQSDNILSMIEAGISSFKIEGRLKDIDYVKTVVAFYNNILNNIIASYPELYERSSKGNVTTNFEPHPEKVFNRTFTSYFLKKRSLSNGIKMASIDTPKSQGEYIGTLEYVRNGNQLRIKTDKILANGDGLSFFAKNGDYTGFRINKVQGNIISVTQPIKIEKGTRLYRTFDKKYNDLILIDTAKRYIKVNFHLVVNKKLLTLEATDERGNRVIVSHENDKIIEIALTDQRVKQEDILKKLGNTIYVANDVKVVGEYFIPNSILADLRRLAIEKLDVAQRISYKFDYRKNEEASYQYFTNELIYSDNICNSLSTQFYNDHGVKSISHALEYNSSHGIKNEILMHTRYCVLRELGLCRKDKKSIKLPQKLYLVNDGTRFVIDTDCLKCEMYIRKA